MKKEKKTTKEQAVLAAIRGANQDQRETLEEFKERVKEPGSDGNYVTQCKDGNPDCVCGEELEPLQNEMRKRFPGITFETEEDWEDEIVKEIGRYCKKNDIGWNVVAPGGFVLNICKRVFRKHTKSLLKKQREEMQCNLKCSWCDDILQQQI